MKHVANFIINLVGFGLIFLALGMIGGVIIGSAVAAHHYYGDVAALGVAIFAALIVLTGLKTIEDALKDRNSAILEFWHGKTMEEKDNEIH